VAYAEPRPAATTRGLSARVFARTLFRGPTVKIGAFVLLLSTLVAVLGPVIAPYSQGEVLGTTFEAPSAAHPLGLDDAGHDVLSELIHGARISLGVGFAAMALSTLLGGLVGILIGYFGGKTEFLAGAVTSYFLVVPAIPIMILVAALWGGSITVVVVVIAALSWPVTAMIISAQTRTVRERMYVQRVLSLGASHWHTISRHVLPQVVPLLVASTAINVATAIYFESALAFLGLGDPVQVSWGRMIGIAFERSAVSSDAWWAIVPPGIAIATVILACTLIGRAVEDKYNPRLAVAQLGRRPFRYSPQADDE